MNEAFSYLKGGSFIMKFFIDTANIEEIRAANELGVLAGVTTNPTLVAKEGVSFHDRLKKSLVL